MQIKPYKNRKIDLYQPVEVYRCLNRKGKWYSVRQKGKVVAHCDSLDMSSCRFIVNDAGKKRCKTSGERNVHAFIRGFIQPLAGDPFSMVPITYDPFSNKGFVAKDVCFMGTEREEVIYTDVHSAAYVTIIKDGGVWGEGFNYFNNHNSEEE